MNSYFLMMGLNFKFEKLNSNFMNMVVMRGKDWGLVSRETFLMERLP